MPNFLAPPGLVGQGKLGRLEKRGVVIFVSLRPAGVSPLALLGGVENADRSAFSAGGKHSMVNRALAIAIVRDCLRCKSGTPLGWT